MADNTRVLSNELDEAEFIDQSVWVPKGEEVIPAMLLINRRAIHEGNRFISTDYAMIDRLLSAGKIEQAHHAVAMKLVNLYRLGTTRQDYAVMKLFMVPNGFDHSDFCPLSLFIRITRPLKISQMRWIRAIVGLEAYGFEVMAVNSLQVRDSIERVADQLSAYEDEQHRRKEMSPAEAHAYR